VLMTPAFRRSTQMALARAQCKPPLEVVVGDLHGGRF
jgi:hypothetical protein